jgi:hypothetical protein
VEVEVEELTMVNPENEGRNMVNFYQTTPGYNVNQQMHTLFYKYGMFQYANCYMFRPI